MTDLTHSMRWDTSFKAKRRSESEAVVNLDDALNQNEKEQGNVHPQDSAGHATFADLL